MAAPAPTTIVLDASSLASDVLTVDALARLQLSAQRNGRLLRLRAVSADLQDLIELVGLSEVLGLEPGGQPEQREQRVGVEEERELDDPAC
jgi:anti-anti-sigma regulatory factor